MKRVMGSALLGVVVSLCISAVASAQSASCGVPYAPKDRKVVHALFDDATALMQRMHELSLQSATSSLSSTQRLALETEFVALRSEIERIGREIEKGSPETRKFLDRVVDPKYLGLDDETIFGSSPEIAVQNAVHAGLALFSSLAGMWRCI